MNADKSTEGVVRLPALLTADLSQLLKDAALRRYPTLALRTLRILCVIRMASHLLLGSTAVVIGTVLFGISLYQFVRYPELHSSRLRFMAEFACAVYMGYAGLKQGLRAWRN
jgi:hypothetical protein